MARLQIKEHTIIESHPDNQNLSFRLVDPFPELENYLQSFDLDSMELKDHAHIPFVVILYKYLQDFKKKHGTIPKTYKEKEILRQMIRKGKILELVVMYTSQERLITFSKTDGQPAVLTDRF